VTDKRREYTQVCDAVVNWASERSDIRGIAIVGSWASSDARMDFDVDLVILTEKVAYSVGESLAFDGGLATGRNHRSPGVGVDDRAPGRTGEWIGD
jgi:hypothetical protein